MYRVNKDKRVIASAARILEGARKCLSTKPLREIGVSDICREASVSRATFYRLFDTPADVLEYSCDSFAENIVTEFRAAKISTPLESTRFILEHWMQHCDMIEAILKSGRHGLLQRSMEAHMKDMASADSNKFTKDEADYVKASIFAQLGSMLMVWVRHGKRESVDDLMRLYQKVHPEV